MRPADFRVEPFFPVESAQAPLSAYRDDLLRCGFSPLSRDDGSWITIATLLSRAVELPRSRKTYVKRACEQVKGMVDVEEIESGTIGEERPTRADSQSDRTSYLLRTVAEHAELHGAFRLSGTLLKMIPRSLPDSSPREHGRANVQIARILIRLNEPSMALRIYRQLDRTGLKAGVPELRARAWLGMGTLAQHRGNYPEARRHSTRALQWFETNGSKKLAISAHRGLTIAAAAARDLNGALLHAWRAYELSTETGKHVESALLNLAQIVLESGHPSAAARGFKAVLTVARGVRIAVLALSGLALAAASSGDESRARWALKQFERLVRRSPDPYITSQSFEECARAADALGDRIASRRLRERALKIATEYRFHEIVYRIENPLLTGGFRASSGAELKAKAAAVVQEVSRFVAAELPETLDLVGA